MQWAKSHNSLLVLTWDEDDYSSDNRIATIFVGARVSAGNYGERIDHYSVLRTIEDMYGLGHAGNSANATPITDIWSTGGGGGGGGTGGGGETGVRQIKASLLREITPHGKTARIAALLKKQSYDLSFKAILAGRVVIDWYYLPRGAHLASGKRKPNPVLVAVGKTTFARAGTVKIPIKLTPYGKRLLKQAKRLTLTAEGVFTPAAKHAVIATQKFTLIR